MAWPKAAGIMYTGDAIGITLEPVEFSMRQRYHVRGKVYLMETGLEVVKDRISKEITTR
jgi:hypothetical protein